MYTCDRFRLFFHGVLRSVFLFTNHISREPIQFLGRPQITTRAKKITASTCVYGSDGGYNASSLRLELHRRRVTPGPVFPLTVAAVLQLMDIFGKAHHPHTL